jgi:GNAT superfamily N-acetyltransferase
MDYKIVVAKTATDFKTILKLDRRCFPDDAHVNLDDAIYFLAIEAITKRPVAFGGIVMTNGGWYLRRAGVLPSARKNGLQKRLIQARVRFAQTYRPDYPIITYTVHDNVPSQRALVSCGFVPFSPKDKYGGDSSVYWIHKGVTP